MAQLSAEQLRIADVYAAALFDLARDSGTIDETRAELDELRNLLDSQPEFATFMASRGIGAERREEALERMFRGRLSDLTLNALLVMNRHDRSDLLAALHRRYVIRQEEASDEIEGQAVSAVELSADQKSEVEKLAARLSGKKPLMEYQVDAGILGGLVLRIGDMRWDNSLRTKLLAARGVLFERADRGFDEDAR